MDAKIKQKHVAVKSDSVINQKNIENVDAPCPRITHFTFIYSDHLSRSINHRCEI